ncbi:MAG: 4Fe-4S dicluster domain-containing protein [Planctomycetota bacterium]|nr:MAG: 4Fe-4S dicluster domain-containing protein [Planctomycetota bacterium]
MMRFERIHRERSEAIERGSHQARLIHPDIDLAKCIGCGTCVRACPEDGVVISARQDFANARVARRQRSSARVARCRK